MRQRHLHSEPTEHGPYTMPAIFDQGDLRVATKGDGACLCETEENIVWGTEETPVNTPQLRQ